MIRRPSIDPANPSHDGGASSALGVGFAWVIVELAPDGILVSDDDGEIVMANRQDRGHVRLRPRCPRSVARWRACSRPGRGRCIDCIGPGIRMPREPRAMGAGLELLGLHADGTEFPVEISLSAVAADHGPVTVAVIRDLRPQRAREQVAHATAVSDEDDRISSALNDRIIHHLFASGLSIAAVLSDHALDDRASERLRGRSRRTRCRGARHPHHDLPTPRPNTRHATRRLTTCPAGDFLTQEG